jgi:hypothetical protein
MVSAEDGVTQPMLGIRTSPRGPQSASLLYGYALFSASAPETTSRISFVMAAWRVLL